MRTWTVDEMLACHPCYGYDRPRLEGLWAGRERLTVLDILDLDIPAADRVWAALQDGDHVPAVVERIVTRAITDHALRCGISEVEWWAARWLSGEDRSEAAAWAARAAAREAACEAAWAAAWAAWAACAAAREAAWAAAREAAWAAWAAEAAEAERRLQIEDIRTVVAAHTKGDE